MIGNLTMQCVNTEAQLLRTIRHFIRPVSLSRVKALEGLDDIIRNKFNNRHDSVRRWR